MSGNHDSRAIANEILLVAGKNGMPLTIMQVIKLAYMSHGFSLSILDRPMSAHEVQAWQYGPVFPHVYKAFKKAGSLPVGYLADNKETGIPFSARLDDDEKKIIESVVKNYGGMHVFELSNIMHRDGTPWSVTFKEKGPYSPIPNELIKSHFLSLTNRDGTGKGY